MFALQLLIRGECCKVIGKKRFLEVRKSRDKQRLTPPSPNQFPGGNPAQLSCNKRTWIQKSLGLEMNWHTMVPRFSGLVT